MDTLEIDRFVAPQAADDLQPFVGLAAARLGVEVERAPFRRERAADAKGRQQAALRQYVDRRALLGEEDRVAKCEREHIDAEFEAAGPPGERRHHRHAFEDWLPGPAPFGVAQRGYPARPPQIPPPP